MIRCLSNLAMNCNEVIRVVSRDTRLEKVKDKTDFYRGDHSIRRIVTKASAALTPQFAPLHFANDSTASRERLCGKLRSSEVYAFSACNFFDKVDEISTK